MQTNTVCTSPAAKATVNRTFTVSNGRTLTLPLLPLHSLEIASSPEAEAYVVEYIHDSEIVGIPHVHLYAESGIILQPLNNTTVHILTVVDDGHALNNLAKYHYTYSRLGYTLLIDETTFLVDLPQIPKSTDCSETTSPADSDSELSKASAVVPNSKQSKLDVVGMEVA